MKPALVQDCRDYPSVNVTHVIIEDEHGVITLPNTEEAVRSVYHPVTIKDEYRLKQLDMTVMTAVDLGASWGVATRLIHALWPLARIVAFEPYKPRFALLQANCPFSDNVCGAIVGQGTRSGFITSAGEPIKVDGSKAWLARSVLGFPIDLLKIDVEGWEGDVLEDLLPVVKPKMIVGEWHFDENQKRLESLLRDDYYVEWGNESGNPWDNFWARLR